MAQTWPSALQDFINESGFTQTFGDTTIKSTVDVGQSKKRARYTVGFDKFTTTIDLDRTDYSTFETFYKTTLANGTLTFNYDHPVSGVATEFRMDVPRLTPMGGTYFRVTMTWEEVV